MTVAYIPPWVVLHIPHDSIVIPNSVRNQFLLSDDELNIEIMRMTDHFTRALFAEPESEAIVVCAPVSRLVVDVERFPEDTQEPMAARGMGAIYEVTSHGLPLRRKLSIEERKAAMRDWYAPHHDRLEVAVTSILDRFDRCLVIDCHSFPGKPLPYENADPFQERPDICIGSDQFHTPKELEFAFVEAFSSNGWQVEVNKPFSGSLVPASRYCADSRVTSLMVEINRDLYLDPFTFKPNLKFLQVSAAIKKSCSLAIKTFAKAKNSFGEIEVDSSIGSKIKSQKSLRI
jgi:N-formylglutamate amidohydrolase